MNTIGKFLVLMNVAVSVVMLIWALTIFLDPIDWGRKNPRLAYNDPPKDTKEKTLPNQVVASELQKHNLRLKFAVDARPRAELRLEKALNNRNSLELLFAAYHLKYLKKIEELENSPDAVAIHEPKYDDQGLPVLEPKGMVVLDHNNKPVMDDKGNVVIDTNKRIGFPVFEDKALADANQSYVTYAAELDKILVDIYRTSEKITNWIAQEEKLTVRVTGVRDPLGKFIVPGYHDLMELEAQAQRRLKIEIEYVQPLWVRELVNAQLLLERSRGLKARLQELGDKKFVLR